jgi:two-component system cell cycle response regulator
MRILIAEDDGFSRRFLAKSMEQWDYEIIFAGTGDEAWEILSQEDAPKLVILNWMLPGMDGLDLCRKIRKHQRGTSTYIIMFTASRSTADLVGAINTGADDFVTKSFDVRELEVRLRAGKRIVELEEALWTLATRDSLTKLWNRAAILDVLDREISRASRNEANIGLVMADIDHFKQINDSCGHKGGDAALVQVAKRLADNLRKYDTIGRYGGEEFLVIVPEPGETTTETVAERLRLSIAETPFQIEGQVVPITMSFGAAVACCQQQLNADLLIRTADEALYRAKANGRNRVESITRLLESSVASAT